jgi:transposase
MLASSQETRVVKTGMDEASSTSIISTRPKKRYRSLEERRQIVEEALVPGVSVAAIARAHGVNANLLFHWRKLYQAGLLSTQAEQGEVRLLPVRVEREGKRKRARHAEAAREEEGTLEVTLPKAQVRVAGKVNSEVLRVVLRCLLG